MRWTVVSDEHVRFANESHQGISTGIGFQVNDGPAFIDIQAKEPAALFDVRPAVRERTGLTRRVTPRGFHLDDIGAQIGESPGAYRAWDSLRPFDYPNV